MTTKDYQEFESLTPAQKSMYWEAEACGAEHADAMEAALTDGYTL